MKKILTALLLLLIMILCVSCGDTQPNEQSGTPTAENNTPASDNNDNDDDSEKFYIIADYYNEDGTFSDLGLALDEIDSEKVLILKNGEAFIIGDRKYRIMTESLTVSFYTQPSFDEVMQWWADYIKIWEESNNIVEIT